MLVLKTKNFSRWSKKERVSDAHLKTAVNELLEGLSVVNLGGGLFKKRIAKAGSGKSGSYRTLMAYKKEDRIIFMFGFSKSDRNNIDQEEKEIYKKLAQYYLKASNIQIKKLCKAKELIEVKL